MGFFVLVFFPFLVFFVDPFDNKFLFTGIRDVFVTLEEVHAAVVPNTLVAAVNFLFHEHRRPDVMDLRVGT